MDKYRRCILGAFIILAEYHILWNLFYPYLWKFPYQQIEFAFAICLVLAAGLYFGRNVIIRHDNISHILGSYRNSVTFEHAFIILLFLWFIADCLLQQSIDNANYLQINDWKLFCSGMAAFVFFSFVKVVGSKSSKGVIERMIHVTVLPYSVFWGWALWQYYHLNFVTFPSGNQLKMVGVRWLEAGTNRNVTAAHSAVMLALCIYMIVTQRKKGKALYLFAAIVHIIVVMLTDSRTSYVAVICTICAALQIGLYRQHCLRGASVISILKRTLLITVITILCIIILAVIRKGTFAILDYCLKMYNGGSLDPTTAISSLDDLDGRDKIWIGTIKMLLSSPKRFVIGVIPSQIGITLMNLGFLKIRIAHCHNVLLEVGASLGVPTMLLYAWFLFSIFLRCIHMIGAKGQQYDFAWAIPIVLLCLVVIDMAESFLFGPTSANMPIFYMFAGWITVLDERYKVTESKKEKKE